MAVKPVYTITAWSCHPKKTALTGTGAATGFPRLRQDLQDQALYFLRGTVLLVLSSQPLPHPVERERGRAGRLSTASERLARKLCFPPAPGEGGRDLLPAGAVLITPIHTGPNPDAVSPLEVEATLPPAFTPPFPARCPRAAGPAQGCSTILSLLGETATKWALFEMVSIGSFSRPA